MIREFTGGYRWLSNFVGGVEQKYQAAKCVNEAVTKEVLAMSPGAAKRFSRFIEIRPDWESIKLGVMEDLVREKFRREPYRTLLLYTGDEEIVEGNRWGDKFWGVCDGVGENHLGQIIMKVRDELRGDSGCTAPTQKP